MRWSIRFGLLASALALATPVLAQDARMTATAAPAEPSAIPLNTGGVKGQAAPEAWFSQYGVAMTRNVTSATLTPFLPDPAKATGAAVIVAPGGGFESGTAGWSLTGGAKIVNGNESFGWFQGSALNGSKSLALPVGATATSPAFCVDETNPHFRFMAKADSSMSRST